MNPAPRLIKRANTGLPYTLETDFTLKWCLICPQSIMLYLLTTTGLVGTSTLMTSLASAHTDRTTAGESKRDAAR
jgi:hypothetical protein